jgi:hypothetical protein
LLQRVDVCEQKINASAEEMGNEIMEIKDVIKNEVNE